jgi:hypothetical protein
MKSRRLALILLVATATSGCGAMFNSSTATVNGPPGTEVDGNPVPATVSQKSPHQVTMPNGQRCTLESAAAGKYIILNILFTGLIGIVIDAATGDWKTLDAAACPGITVH